MNEGMRCDRISLMNAGKVLACDAPQKLIDGRGASGLEDAFIGYMEDAIADAASKAKTTDTKSSAAAVVAPSKPRSAAKPAGARLGLTRMMAYAANETAKFFAILSG